MDLLGALKKQTDTLTKAGAEADQALGVKPIKKPGVGLPSGDELKPIRKKMTLSEGAALQEKADSFVKSVRRQ